MNLPAYEKLGVFYLGRRYDAAAGKPTDELLLYDTRDLLTHAVILGMTGSGKTGLGLGLLEEAAIDGVPAIVIDPKGDLGNLLLAFPELRAENFRPWIDPEEASRQGVSPDALAARTAEDWRRGLADWGQDGQRIGRYLEACEAAIYTPGSGAGLRVSALGSLGSAPATGADDEEAWRDRLLSTVSAVLSLAGVEADPVRSREHILLSNLLESLWRAGETASLPDLVRLVQSPPIERIGALDLESFYPARDRTEFSLRLNNLLAAPGFKAWTEGEPLDVARLLRTRGGKPRLSIFSIAHLDDRERMFFVTLLLGEILAWMRSQPGTSSLRAVLYMDEIFGFFPPTANPPSKPPMLALLKQARAFGLGIVLATQNPVDLDYKGLSNTGTWFLGRLQTERDKLRVLDGLEGCSSSTGGAFDRAETDRLLSGLGHRVFLMNNVHEQQPVLFQTRWTLSFLRGPLTRAQIQQLARPRTPLAVAEPLPMHFTAGTAGDRPVVPPGITELFAAPLTSTPATEYEPALLGVAKVHYVEAKAAIDEWQSVNLLAFFTGEQVNPWERAEETDAASLRLGEKPAEGARFAAPPTEALQPNSYPDWHKRLADWIYRSRSLLLWRCPVTKLVSRPNETETDFRARLAQALREKRDREDDAIRKRYASKFASLQERLRRAEEREARERGEYDQQKLGSAISIGATVLGALFGRKIASTGNIGRAATAARSVGRASKEKGDVDRAAENVETVRQQIADLEKELQAEAEALPPPSASGPLEELRVAPRKSDLVVEQVALAWIAR